jgi:hypothetical protein
MVQLEMSWIWGTLVAAAAWLALVTLICGAAVATRSVAGSTAGHGGWMGSVAAAVAMFALLPSGVEAAVIPLHTWDFTMRDVLWMLGASGATCDAACVTNGFSSCDEASLTALAGYNPNDGSIQQAFRSAGYACTTNTQQCSNGNGNVNNCEAWGSPYIHAYPQYINSGACFFGGNGSGIANCGVSMSQHRRLCPCSRAVSLPSNSIADSTGGIAATLENGATRTATGVVFDGIDDHINLNLGSVQLGGPMTIAMLMRNTIENAKRRLGEK